ncbi:MAG: TlpA family protein disulfide reductase [Blastocatellia bacterium]
MNRKAIKERIEFSTNIAVLLAALAVLATVGWRFLAPAPRRVVVPGLRKGSNLAKIPGVEFGAGSRTLLIGLSTRCAFCSESLPFFKDIMTASGLPADSAENAVAVFPEQESDVRRYGDQNGLKMKLVPAVNLRSRGITATPTAILVDGEGRVLGFWVGRPNDETQRQIYAEFKRTVPPR